MEVILVTGKSESCLPVWNPAEYHALKTVTRSLFCSMSLDVDALISCSPDASSLSFPTFSRDTKNGVKKHGIQEKEPETSTKTSKFQCSV